jgi:hypothetical protein
LPFGADRLACARMLSFSRPPSDRSVPLAPIAVAPVIVFIVASTRGPVRAHLPLVVLA